MKMLTKLLGIVLVAFLIIPNVLASDYGSGSGGLSLYGTGSGGLNPYGSGSGGLNPYGIGTGGLNPYGVGTGGLNPYGTGSGGLNPYGGSSTFTPTGTTPTTNNPNGPNPNPSPGPGNPGPIWGQLSNQIISEDSSVGTMVYRGLKSLCFDSNGVNMAVTTTSPNFDLRFSGNDLVLNRLTLNWNGQELVGLSCNGNSNSFVLTVSPVNDAPTFTTSPVTTGTKNVQYSYDANAVDVENNPFTFALINGPSGMTINTASGLVSWRPSSSQTGSYTVQIRVTDNQGASSNQAYTISVGNGGSSGSGSSSGGSKNKHNVEIASLNLADTSLICGEKFDLIVSLANLGSYSEAVSVKVENSGLGIAETKSTTVVKGRAENLEFNLDIDIDDVTEGSYNLVAKLTYGAGSDSATKIININCDKEVEKEEVIITTEPEEKKNILMTVTLVLAILAGLGLLTWFVLLLKDEFYSTEKFI